MRMMRIGKKSAAIAIGLASTLVIAVAASADTGYATAAVTQVSTGTVTTYPAALPECNVLLGVPDFVPIPGFTAYGEVFAGPFTHVSGKSKESKLLSKSGIEVAQNATVCLVSAPDESWNASFYGAVQGVAAITRVDGRGKHSLTAEYGSPVAGTVNLATGAITVQWLEGGAYQITGVSGKYADAFEVAETGAATATAYSHGYGSPEVGTLAISFDFKAKDR